MCLWSKGQPEKFTSFNSKGQISGHNINEGVWQSGLHHFLQREYWGLCSDPNLNFIMEKIECSFPIWHYLLLGFFSPLGKKKVNKSNNLLVVQILYRWQLQGSIELLFQYLLRNSQQEFLQQVFVYFFPPKK